MSSQQYTNNDILLEWPDGYNRSDPADREPYPGNLSVSHTQAFESIGEQLKH
ncbi:hypothetical protein [Natrinema halophilum]|uniref:hypothetical protein n=1 Tax=Natrinema halophilum TaxID=1699371 RepID=UPI001F24D334|nr:hypothetical protein [Natrinema halophilum]UHQ96344.1 hypothetical protein HYG82_22050 [Natrinema halophilum]